MEGAFDLSLFDLPTAKMGGTSSLAAPILHPQPSIPTSVDQPITGEEFLAGPIRMGWLEAVAKVSGAAFPVALLVRHLHMMRGRDWVVLSNKAVERFGISASAKARAVAALKEAGLIEVQSRQLGCAPRVKPVGDR